MRGIGRGLAKSFGAKAQHQATSKKSAKSELTAIRMQLNWWSINPGLHVTPTGQIVFIVELKKAMTVKLRCHFQQSRKINRRD